MATTHVGSIYWDASIKGIGAVQKQLKDLQAQIDALKPKRQKEGLFTQILGGAKGLLGVGSILAKASRFITRLGDRVVHFGQITSVFSYRLSILLAGFAALGVKIGVVAAEFEENLAQIGTQLDIRGTQLEEFTGQLGQHIIDLSKELPVAANDIARAMYFIVSSMDVPEETAQAILEPLSIAAVAGRSTVEEIAGAVAVIGNVYDHILVMADGTARFVKDDMEGAIALTNATAEQVAAAVTHTTDVLFEGVQKGRAEVRDYTSQVGDFLQVAASAGASLEEALAFFTSATRITTSSQAATWTANFYRQLLRPEFAEKLAEWGIQLEQIVEGTGEWATRQRELNKEEERNLEQVNRKLKGAEGVTGLYLKEAKLIENIGYVQWQISQKDSAARQKSLRDKNRDLDITKQQIAFYEKQGEAIASLDQQQVRYWTGKETFRPTLDIFADLVEVIENTSSKQEQLNMITAAFPNVRATQAFLRFIGAYKDIVTWSKEWETVTGQTQEAFELMADTVNARIFVLKNNIFALGMAFYLAYEDQIKVFIDGLTSIVMLFQTLDPALVRQIALWGLLIVAMAPLMLLIGTLAIGFGTLVTTIGMLVSPGVLGVAGALFMIFGDKLKLALDALKGFGISDMEDAVQFFMDLAVQLGIISEADAAKILVAFGISLKPMGDPAVLKFIDAFRGMIERIAVLKDDLVEWFDAFRLLLDDIAKREGLIGSIVGYIERLAAAVAPFIGKGATPVAAQARRVLPGGETGPEGKKEILEFAGATYIGTKIVTAILAALGLGGAVPTLGVVAAIGAAVYTAMHPEEVENFFTVELPKWWEDKALPFIDYHFGIELPLWWKTKVRPLIEHFWETWLPTWWETVALPSWDKFWEEDFPLWWTTNVKDPIVNYFSEGGPFSAWWTANIKDPVTTFFTTGLSQWFTDNIKDPVVGFIESLPERINTFLTVTVPNKIGFWMGYIAGQALIALDEWPPKIIAWISETGWPNLIEWIEKTGWPTLRKALTFSITGWLKGELLKKVEEGLFVDIVGGVVAVFKTGWDGWKRAWKSFLEGFAEGFWTALFGPGGRSEEEEHEGEVQQFGGIIQRTGRVLAHAGEVFFNPRYPRQDLARVVNSAMARAGGGGELAPVTVTANVNIGSFGGSQAEMNQLQRMLENMSFDMAMRVERKLAEARRVENRRRE